MDGFLNKVSDFIFSNYAEQTDELCIVLPNRRAGLFLKKHLGAKFSKPTWSPEIFSIEDFVWELSGLQQADQAEQLFVFYSVYKASEKAKAETFDLFCKWAPTLLNDFNEADAYLADIEQLFGNLSDIRTIENWSLGETSLTDFQKQYLHFWSSIGKWYKLYKEKLLKSNLAYPGLASRIVAENIAQLVSTKKWKKIIFAGFNALNGAEEKIFSVLRENETADLLWDTDRYYLEDKANEAGKFLRSYREKYFRPVTGSLVYFENIENRFSTEEKKITVAGVARMVSQAKAASYFLDQLDESGISTSTAIVLGDEQLLLPLLHALPEKAENINITMGFPLRNTPVASLVNALFQLHMNALRFNIHTREGELKFYHSDLVRLLRHPYIKHLFAAESLAEKADEIISRLNIIFSSGKQLQSKISVSDIVFSDFDKILQPWTDTTIALDGIATVIEMLRMAFKKENTDEENAYFNIEQEYLFQLNIIIKRAKTLHAKWNIAGDLKSLRALIEQQISSSALPFYGEPLTGLQIMGVLETRTLDFENVILLSANENIFPGSKVQHTFIMFDLRKYFGLPTWDDKDAIAAYHFYRLLQRAKNIFIIHNTDQDTFGNREKSRFVTQIMYELPVANKKVKIEEVVFDAKIQEGGQTSNIISIPKSGAVLEKLKGLATSGLSPSLLNSYRSCSLQFYFHYIAGLREADEVEETIGADTLGTIIHGALEELYKPIVGSQLTVEFFDAAKKKVVHTCEGMFAKHFSQEESGYGKNLLAKKIAIRYINNYLDSEKKKIKTSQPITVAALETILQHSITIDDQLILLKGTADRVDQSEHVVTLVDYKTGKADKKELIVREWMEIIDNPVIGKSFQLLMYAWLYSKINGTTLPISSGIISFRKISDGFMNVITPEGDFIIQETLLRFEESFRELLTELFDEEKEFEQTEDLKICRICDFKEICRR
jgi:hypothetical protein